jgi:hypothetical protein
MGCNRGLRHENKRIAGERQGLAFIAVVFAGAVRILDLSVCVSDRSPHTSLVPANLAEISGIWFLFVTPVTTVIAIVTLVKHGKIRVMFLAKLITWLAIVLSFVLNAVVLLGLWASTY